jgi:hypothetical protein
MKRISILVLLILALVATLVACNDPAPAETHEHSYTDEWCADATNHWHVADCEHTDKVTSKYPHKNTDGNGACDQCGYKVAWTVSVDADEVVTADEVVYVDKTAGSATFTVSASDIYKLNVEGATLTGTPAVENGVATYTYTVTASADAEVTIDAVKVKYVTAFGSDTVSFDEEGNAKFEAKVNLKNGEYIIEGFSDNEDLWASVSLFDAEGNEIEKDWFIDGYAITEDGEYTVTVSVYSEDLESVLLGYSVVDFSDVEIDIVAGEVYTLASGVEYILLLPIAEDGMYKISTSVEGIQLNYETGYYMSYFVAGTTAEFTVSGSADTVSYDFDWTAEKTSASVTLENGENTVALPVGETVVVEFVAPAEGNYYFAAANWSSMLTYSYEYGWMYNIWEEDAIKLEEGESILICVRMYEEEDIEETITVTYEEPNPSFSVEITNEYTYTYDARYEFIAEVSGTYTFYFPEFVSVGFADEIDDHIPPFLDIWTDPEYVDGLFAYDVDIAAGESVTFAFNASEVGTIEVSYVVFEHEVEAGGDEIVELPESIVGVYSGYNRWGTAAITATITETEIILEIDGMFGASTASFTYTYEDGIVTLYGEDGSAITNPMMGYVTVKSAELILIGYNGTDYTVSPVAAE